MSLGTDLVKHKLLGKGIEAVIPNDNNQGNILLLKSFEKRETVKVLTRTSAKQKSPSDLPELVWRIKDSEKADYIAVVDFHTSSVWLFNLLEFKNACQQYSKGTYRFRMVTVKQKKEPLKKSFIGEFNKFLL